MATDTSENVLPIDPDYGSPKHIIIWLDAYIGDPTKCIQLKRAFLSSIDPRSQTWTRLSDRDYHNLIASDSAVTVYLGGVLFLLIGFTDPDACYRAFERYRTYRIFFITSGSLGECFVPRILPQFQDVFTDPVSNEPYESVYVFCGYIASHVNWAIRFRDHLQMFDHEQDLLARMVRDAAAYFFTLAERESPTEHPDEALLYYNWSKKLYLEYERLDEKATAEIRTIDERTAQIEANKRDAHMTCSDDDDDKVAESCT